MPATDCMLKLIPANFPLDLSLKWSSAFANAKTPTRVVAIASKTLAITIVRIFNSSSYNINVAISIRIPKNIILFLPVSSEFCQ